MLSFALLLLAAQPGPLYLDSWDPDRCNHPANYELQKCASARIRYAERILNQEWQALARKLKADDAEAPRRGESKTFPTALASQRAWLKYRDAQCRFEYNEYEGGSHAPLAQLICIDRLTRARAVELRDMQRP